MSGNPSPLVVRSQRNNDRRPIDRDVIELEATKDGEAAFLQPALPKLPSLPEPGSLSFESCGKLRLVRPKDHLGYFSTRHVTLRRCLAALAKLIELFTDAAH